MMLLCEKTRLALCCFFVLCAGMAKAGAIQNTAATPEYAVAEQYVNVYNQLADLEADAAKVGIVSGFMMQRDAAIITLASGTLYLLKPVNGRVPGAVFIGEGEFSLDPPIEVEKEQMRRFFGVRSMQKSFTRMLFLFGDETLAEFEAEISFSRGSVEEKATSYLGFARDYLLEPGHKAYEATILQTFLDNARNTMFTAFFSTGEDEPLMFRITPYNAEEISLSRKMVGLPDQYKYLEVINQFHKQEDYWQEQDLAAETGERIYLEHYESESRISDDLAFRAVTGIRYRALQDDVNWIKMNLYAGLRIDSIKTAAGEHIEFSDCTGGDEFRRGRVGSFWFRNPRTLQTGERDSIILYYHGNLLERRIDIVLLLSSTHWYPQLDNLQHSEFDLKFHCTKEYELVASGKELERRDAGEYVYSHWHTGRPVPHVSFNVGIFKEHKIESDTVPPVRVLLAKNRTYVGSQTERRFTAGADISEDVAFDIHTSLAFYEKLFGPCPDSGFIATEIPFGHGQAFPGMIHLSFGTFEAGAGSKGSSESFRAHEVGHQWWGMGVDQKSYHDQWISEAFAEYSSLMYMQMVLKDNDLFLKHIGTARKELLDNRQFLFGEGQETGPIWLGYRNNTSTTAGDYFVVVYKKGAYVLHMLRNMLINLNTFDETTFLAILRDFYQSYYLKRASTEDFQKIVEKHLNADMQWFFDQWVYGTGIPTYRIATRTRSTGDGKYIVSCKVEQQDVPETFYAQMPIRLDFGNDQLARMRVAVTGKVAEFDLPPLPIEPEEIEWNEFQSVLCRIDLVDWDDIQSGAGTK